MAKRATKETTINEADKAAEQVKQKGDLEKLVLEEAMKITDGKTHSCTMLMAYCRQIKKRNK